MDAVLEFKAADCDADDESAHAHADCVDPDTLAFLEQRRLDPDFQRRSALVDAALAGETEPNPMTLPDLRAALGITGA